MKRLVVCIACLLLQLLAFGQEQEGNRKVAILETVDKEGTINYGVKLMVRSNLAAAITNTKGYEGYDRVDIASIMSEQNFQRTGMVSDAEIKKLGEMTGAAYILVAEVAKMDEDNIFITAKIMNVETAKLEQTSNVQSGIAAETLQESCRQLAGALFGKDAVGKRSSGAVQPKKPNGVSDESYIEEVVFYLPAFKTSKNDSKLPLNVYLDGEIIGSGSVGAGFDIKVNNVSAGLHELKISGSAYAIEIGKFKYFEFATRKQTIAMGMGKLYIVDLKISR